MLILMEILLHKNFQKKYQKLREGDKKRFKECRDLFQQYPFHPILNNHALAGEYQGYRSINITGDLRVIYEPVGEDRAFFIMIDTHSNLYN